MPLAIDDYGTAGHMLTVRTSHQITKAELHMIMMIWAHDTFLFGSADQSRDLSQVALLDAVRETIGNYGFTKIAESAVGTPRPENLISWESPSEHEFCKMFADDQIARHWRER